MTTTTPTSSSSSSHYCAYPQYQSDWFIVDPPPPTSPSDSTTDDADRWDWVDRFKSAMDALQDHDVRHCPVLGFDMEWTTQRLVSIDASPMSSSATTFPQQGASQHGLLRSGDHNAALLTNSQQSSGTTQRRRADMTTVSGKTAVLQLCGVKHSVLLRLASIAPFVEAQQQQREEDHDAAAFHHRNSLLMAAWSQLERILAAHDVHKVGIGVHGDAAKIKQDWGLQVNGCCDLHHVRKLLGFHLLTTDERERLHDNRNDEDTNNGKDEWILLLPSSSSSSSSSSPRACRSVVQKHVAGLKQHTAYFTGVALAKDAEITVSDWGNVDAALTQAQVEYALDDARASLHVGLRMLEIHIGRSSSPSSSSGSFCRCGVFGAAECAPEALAASPLLKETLAGWVKVERAHVEELELKQALKQERREKQQQQQQQQQSKPTTQTQSQTPQKGDEAKEMPCRKQRYYDNIRVLDMEKKNEDQEEEQNSPGSRLLFTVDKNKANWYVFKMQLAAITRVYRADTGDEEVYDETKHLRFVRPKAQQEEEQQEKQQDRYQIAEIQLFFSPSFDRYHDSHIRRDMEYYRIPKENICVICGASERLVRFSIVPTSYRKHFPRCYVSHNSYDIVLVCTGCAGPLNAAYDQERQLVAEEYGFPASITNAHRQEELAVATGGGGANDEDDGEDESGGGKRTLFQRTVLHQHQLSCFVRQASALFRDVIVRQTIEKRQKEVQKEEEKESNEAAALGAKKEDEAEEKGAAVTPKQEQQKKEKKKHHKNLLPEEVRAKYTEDVAEAAKQYKLLPPPSSSSQATEQAAVFGLEDLQKWMKIDYKRFAAQWAQQECSSSDVGMEEDGAASEQQQQQTKIPSKDDRQKRNHRHRAPPKKENGKSEEVENDDDNDSSASSILPDTNSHSAYVVRQLLLRGFAANVAEAKEKGIEAPKKEKNSTANDHRDDVAQDGEASVTQATLDFFASKRLFHVDYRLGEFILRWRQRFVHSMRPSHLPKGWKMEEGILLPSTKIEGEAEKDSEAKK